MPGDRPGKTEIRIRSVVAEMRAVVAFVERFGRDHGLPPSITNDLNLCLDEILNNIIAYGYQGSGDHSIRVSMALEGDELFTAVEDEGLPFDLRQAPAPDVAGGLRSRRLGGVGIHFVKSLMDGVDYVRSGRYNRLTLRKKVRRSGSGNG